MKEHNLLFSNYRLDLIRTALVIKLSATKYENGYILGDSAAQNKSERSPISFCRALLELCRNPALLEFVVVTP